MSTLALASADVAVAAAEARTKPSLFQRLIEARERDALRRIHAFLAAQSDDGRPFGIGPKDAARERAMRAVIREGGGSR